MFLCPVTTGVAASHVQGFLGRLLDTALAGTGALLDVADVYVVPNMNPDGSFRGQYCGTYYTSTAAHIIPVLRQRVRVFKMAPTTRFDVFSIGPQAPTVPTVLGATSRIQNKEV